MANLYELENRVFTESWSIPYKREESLGKCLAAATRLAHEGKFQPLKGIPFHFHTRQVEEEPPASLLTWQFLVLFYERMSSIL